MTLASFFAAVVLMAASGQADNPQPRVETAQGALVGRSAEGVTSFKAIPYAAPPVGPLRWRPPQPVEGWTGERDAGQFGAICIQPPANGDNGVGPLPMSEDCLTLNVWTPEGRTGPLSVMVWIHGGGAVNGSGTAALYDGTRLAKRGVVMVTINYRLGRLGVFDHPALAAGRAADEPAGNYGLMDMIAALEWVKANIAAFGGDPGQVTIFGESSGGVAVTQLMISPMARGLFARAAVQSGLGRQVSTRLDRPGAAGQPSEQDRGLAWAASAGLAGADAKALRAAPAERLLEPGPGYLGGDLLLIDGRVVGEDVSTAFAAGRQARVPLLIGTNSAEFWWVKADDSGEEGALDDGFTAEERAAMIAAYGGLEAYKAEVISDLMFNEPARNLARLHVRAGLPTWLYRFDVVSAAMPEPHKGATHASERQYVFDNLTASPWPTGEMDQRAADVMAGYWTTFARTGDPNGQGRPDWPGLTGDGDRLLEFGNDGPEAKAMPNGERLDLIEAYYERLKR